VGKPHRRDMAIVLEDGLSHAGYTGTPEELFQLVLEELSRILHSETLRKWHIAYVMHEAANAIGVCIAAAVDGKSENVVALPKATPLVPKSVASGRT
jgi:Uri superfamily endonuclease